MGFEQGVLVEMLLLDGLVTFGEILVGWGFHNGGEFVLSDAEGQGDIEVIGELMGGLVDFEVEGGAGLEFRIVATLGA